MTRLTGTLSGAVHARPSKSITHRAAICAALAKGESEIENIARSRDVDATFACLLALGAALSLSGRTLSVSGVRKNALSVTLPCGESGSTYRFLYPIAPLVSREARFALSPSLAARPMGPIIDCLAARGVRAEATRVSGGYGGGDFRISGDVSSQFISGLMLALPLAGGGLIELTSPLEGRGYVELTRLCMAAFGADAHWEGDAISVSGGYCPASFAVEGDYSHAATFLAAGALYGGVCVAGLPADTLQGDAEILNILAAMGARVEREGGSVSVSGGPLRGVDMDASQTPDLVPAVAALGAVASGKTRIYNARRLRYKESDRLSAMATELSRLGARVEEREDGLEIFGGARLANACCSSHHDHRVAMALALLSGAAEGGVTLDDTACIDKSAPDFMDDFKALGGIAHE